MKTALITCVNYNSYEVLNDYIKSIDAAAMAVTNRLSVTVAVADNTVENYQDICVPVKNIKLQIYPYHKNYGYMGGAVKILKEIGEANAKKFDFVFVTNVDITLSVDFFVELLKVDTKNIGWIAPSIFRSYDGSNENPFILKMPSKLRMRAYIVMYSFPKLFGWYQNYTTKNRRNIKNVDSEPQTIFAGMGSIFVFTKAFINKCYPLTFPTFMYGEEIYYGYLVQKMNLKTLYVPNIKVQDICSISTSLLGIKRKCDMNKNSLKLISKIIYS